MAEGHDIARLRWQCRRGMRELDVLLSDFLEHRYADTDDATKSAFSRLLTLADPELAAYLLGGQIPGDAALAEVVEKLRNRPST